MFYPYKRRQYEWNKIYKHTNVLYILRLPMLAHGSRKNIAQAALLDARLF